MRRKNELSYKTVDREWPYQVAVPSERTRGTDHDAALAFCANLSLAPRSLSIFHEGIFHNIWCFADPEHARLFKERSDGLDFNPKDRGKGKRWWDWNQPAYGSQGTG